MPPLPDIVLLVNPGWGVCTEGSCRVGWSEGYEKEAELSLLGQCDLQKSCDYLGLNPMLLLDCSFKII